MKILVTGATGNLGSAVIDSLLKHMLPEHIHVFTREEETKVEFADKRMTAFIGNYDDVESLEAAMAAVDTVLLISAGDSGDRMQQHKNVINAAKKMGVKNISYTSRALRDRSTLKNDLMQEHFLTEDLIKESGLNYTIFRNALYMDVVPLFVGEAKVFDTGILQPAGNGEVAYALREEQGEAMGNVLATEPFNNKTYKFTGNQSHSFHSMATVLSELSGKEVAYTPVSVEKFQEIKAPYMPAPMLKKIIDFNIDIEQGQESEITGDLETKLGRKPIDLKEGLKGLFHL